MDDEDESARASDTSQKSSNLFQSILLSDSDEENASGNGILNLIPDNQINENDGQAACSSHQASRDHALSTRNRSFSPDFPVECSAHLSQSPSSRRSMLPLPSLSSPSKQRSKSVPIHETAAPLTMRQMIMSNMENFSESSDDTESLAPSDDDGTFASKKGNKKKGDQKGKGKGKGKSLFKRQHKRSN